MKCSIMVETNDTSLQSKLREHQNRGKFHLLMSASRDHPHLKDLEI